MPSRKVRDCEQCGKGCTTESAFRCAYCSKVLCNKHAWGPNYSMCKLCGDK